MGRVVGVLAQLLEHDLFVQTDQLAQRGELVKALREELHVDVVGSDLLRFQRADDGVQAPKDAAPGRGAAAEGVHTGAVAQGALRAAGAEAHAQDVAEDQAHQGLEPVPARQRVSGQQRPSLVVAGQLLRDLGGAVSLQA